MKAVIPNSDEARDNVSFCLLAAFLFLLPYDRFYSELALACFALHTCIYLDKRKLAQLFTATTWVPVLLFMTGLFGMLYTNDQTEGWNVTGRQSALLLVPLLFALSDLDFKSYRKRLLLVFVCACCIAVVYLFWDAVRTLLFYNLPLRYLFTPAFMNHNFSSPIGLHATYLSLYIAFSIIILLYYLLHEQYGRMRWLYIALVGLLMAAMLLLSSRAAFMGLLLVINLVFPFLLPRTRKRRLFFFSTALLSVLMLALIFSSGAFRERYVNELRSDLSLNPQLAEAMEPRAARWKAAWEIVGTSLWFGHGTGAQHALLMDKYFEKKMYNSYVNEFNAHNQYLAILINTGVAGLLIFFVVQFYAVRCAWKNRDPLFLSFLLMIIVVCISENVLELNKGIFFYAFFLSFFLEVSRKKQHKVRQPLTLPVRSE